MHVHLTRHLKPRTLSTLTLLLICSIAGQLPAQVVWKLPHRGAVFYKRERTAQPAALGGNCGFDRMEMPPILLQGELDGNQQYQKMGPADLRDLPAWLAFDLRKADGKAPVKVYVDTLRGLGTVQVSGTASELAGGEQTLQLKLRTTRASTGPFGATVSGTIRIRRTVDLARGVVTSFATELAATFKPRRAADTAGMPGVGGVLIFT